MVWLWYVYNIVYYNPFMVSTCPSISVRADGLFIPSLPPFPPYSLILFWGKMEMEPESCYLLFSPNHSVENGCKCPPIHPKTWSQLVMWCLCVPFSSAVCVHVCVYKWAHEALGLWLCVRDRCRGSACRKTSTVIVLVWRPSPRGHGLWLYKEITKKRAWGRNVSTLIVTFTSLCASTVFITGHLLVDMLMSSFC